MTQPPGSPTGDDADPFPDPRPRPSWGQPAPGDAATSPLEPYGGQQQASLPTWPHQPSGQQPVHPAWSQPSAAQYGQDLGRHEQAYAQMYGEKPRQGMAIAALVLGILTALLAIFPFLSYFAVLLGVLAVIFGIIGSRRTSGKGMAIAGLILGGLGLVVAILASIFWTRLGIDAVEVFTQCTEETGRTAGPAFDRCVNERSRDITPFG